MLEGNGENVSNFEWDLEYEDFTNRFEAWLEITDVKLQSIQDLYDNLHSWLGITKRGYSLPSQKQMDFFSEFYNQPYYDISSYEREQEEIMEGAPSYEFKSGSLYNEGTHEFARNVKGQYEHYIAEERTFHFKYGDIVVLVDSKTKRILSHFKDISKNEYLGSRY